MAQFHPKSRSERLLDAYMFAQGAIAQACRLFSLTTIPLLAVALLFISPDYLHTLGSTALIEAAKVYVKWAGLMCLAIGLLSEAVAPAVLRGERRGEIAFSSQRLSVGVRGKAA